jgi:hypothetical protein
MQVAIEIPCGLVSLLLLLFVDHSDVHARDEACEGPFSLRRSCLSPKISVAHRVLLRTTAQPGHLERHLDSKVLSPCKARYLNPRRRSHICISNYFSPASPRIPCAHSTFYFQGKDTPLCKDLRPLVRRIIKVINAILD